ncbi:DNA repair protein RecO [Thalassotalea insulae]|uniref:DNA repair protein RecO n=1 Tax=Thalassotalea insulae TaxID=2056778 RepID=A0ABQ6GU11_9GAMM|nr:DNA repair protein RecO [Thalassotalea insulae]GLX79418.1 DNA repair protein RecO [Thalassotalea insulae]
MNELEQNAFLLHSRPYRDNKVIVEFLTQQQGKVSALAYIGTSVKSSKKALLQPFIPLQIVLKGQGALKTLTRIESQSKSYLLTGEHLYSGFYLNELQVRLLGENVPVEVLYQQYQLSLVRLSERAPLESILREFESVLLDELGLTIDYSVLFEQDHPYYHYLPEQGLVPAAENIAVKLPKIHLLQIAEQQLADKAVRTTYKLLMRQVFEYLLDGKPLNSRKLFKRN